MDAGSIKTVTRITVIRVLFVSNDTLRRERWIDQASLSLTVNAALAGSTREALMHLSEEGVDVIVPARR